MPPITFDRYPAGIVAVACALEASICLIGAWILLGFGYWAAGAFIAYCLLLEIRVLTRSCTGCHYYGKRCGLGKGWLCAKLVARGDPEAHARNVATWWDIAPDLAVGFAPIVAAIVLLIRSWSWGILAAMIVLLALNTFGNGLVRGKLLCPHCRQRELGCPALKLFEKAGKTTADP